MLIAQSPVAVHRFPFGSVPFIEADLSKVGFATLFIDSVGLCYHRAGIKQITTGSIHPEICLALAKQNRIGRFGISETSVLRESNFSGPRTD